MLAQECAGFRERQLLRIVAGEAKPFARRELRNRACQRVSDQLLAPILVGAGLGGAGFSRPTRGNEFIVWQRFQSLPRAQAVDVPLRKHGTEPRREAAASVEVTKKRALEEFAVDAIRQVAGAALGIERVSCAIERRTLFANEVFPRLFVARGAPAGEREIVEVQRLEICAAFGASIERFSKPLERHPPALGACPQVKALGERGVDRQPSHSTPGALIRNDAQEHADRTRKQCAAQLPAKRGNEGCSGHDHDET